MGRKFSSACGAVTHIKDEIYAIGWGRTENDKKCMSVYDFAKGEELLSVNFNSDTNFT